MHWLLIGYMFLFIHRPFEVWPALGDLRIERIYMLLTLAVWLIAPGKRWLPNGLHFAYGLFATSVAICWVSSPWSEQSQRIVEDYFKILVFYMLLVTSVNDERGLKRMVIGFMAVMALYLTHSLREFLGGRHVYRMGFSRLIGVDSSMGDPNSFGASIVFVLPFITAFWQSRIGGQLGRWALLAFSGLAIVCLLLTGSRSSFLGLIMWLGLLTWSSQRRSLALIALLIAAPLVFLALPDSLQNRFETIVNPDVGPEIAKESGQGRLLGLTRGFDLWQANPLFGVGPGAWRPATGSSIESHNLYGQLMGEMGTAGICGFLAVLVGVIVNLRAIAQIRRQVPEWSDDFLFHITKAVGLGFLLLLFMGNFGHNLFRYSWLWYGGFLLIIRHCLEVRLQKLDFETEWDELDDEVCDDEASEFAEGYENSEYSAANR